MNVMGPIPIVGRKAVGIALALRDRQLQRYSTRQEAVFLFLVDAKQLVALLISNCQTAPLSTPPK